MHKSTYDPADEWEFKILRSAAGKFRNPVWLRTVLDEEALSGWTLVEKFDDTRLRLKRRMAARAQDAALSFDPTRTSIGPGPGYVLLPLLLGILTFLAAILWFAGFFHIGGSR